MQPRGIYTPESDHAVHMKTMISQYIVFTYLLKEIPTLIYQCNM